jgi:hypothetical protein
VKSTKVRLFDEQKPEKFLKEVTVTTTTQIINKKQNLSIYTT